MSNKKLIKRKVLTLMLLSSCNFYLLNSATSAKAMFLNNLFHKISSKVSKKEEAPAVQKAPAVWKAAEVKKTPKVSEAEMKQNSDKLIQCIKTQKPIEELEPLLQKPLLFDETHNYVNDFNVLGVFIAAHKDSFGNDKQQENFKKLRLILDWSRKNTPRAINEPGYIMEGEYPPTPLITAIRLIRCQSTREKVCEMLLEDQNIDVNIKWKGKTALDWALELRRQEIASLLHSKGAMRSNPNTKKVENVCTFKAVPCKQKNFQL